ncbi:hypothetical protein [Oceanisphaera sp. KMM 10153]|uniref:hypothetical protein n=1 Tax=Oceanisphaera submarina TaxID=3390193 RepID=UPI003977077C
MQTQQADIGRLMAEHLYQSQRAIEEVSRLQERVNNLQSELELLKQSGGDQGWMTIKKAAPLVGMTTNALSQRFRRGAYPEGVVWILNSGRYVVHLRALREHMARSQK